MRLVSAIVSGTTCDTSPSMSHSNPCWIPSTSTLDRLARMVAAPMTLLMPGAGPPATTIPSLFEWLTGVAILSRPTGPRSPHEQREDHCGQDGSGGDLAPRPPAGSGRDLPVVRQTKRERPAIAGEHAFRGRAARDDARDLAVARRQSAQVVESDLDFGQVVGAGVARRESDAVGLHGL